MHRDKNSPVRTSRRPLTAASIRAVKLGQTVADGYGDRGHGTLKLRRRENAGGIRTEWLFEWTVAGTTRRMSIGPYSEAPATGSWTLAQAHEELKELQGVVKAGGDPLAQRELQKAENSASERAQLAAVREAQEKTLAVLVAAYVENLRKQGKVRSADDAAGMFGLHVAAPFPDIAGMPAAQVQPGHITKVLARLVQPIDGGRPKGRTALKLRTYLGAAFKLALGAGLDPMAPTAASGFGLESNPAAIVPSATMAARFNRTGERALSPDELHNYVAYVASFPSPMVRLLLQLQLATGGQRIQQLVRLQRSDIGEGVMTLRDPKGRRAQPRIHVLPLVPEVREILDELAMVNVAMHGQVLEGLFATRGRDGQPGELAPEVPSEAVYMISNAMQAAGLARKPFRGGDIRRTVETLMAERLRISKDDRAQLLSHGLSGVQDRHYDRAEYLDTKRAHLRRWNDYLHELCVGPDRGDESNVVPLVARAA